MRILAEILALITRHKREKVDIKWSNKNWTHNIFRVWELIFWRRAGIRKEMYSDSWGNRKAYTLEAHCALFETRVREFLSYLEYTFSFRWVPSPLILRGAIALDSADTNAYASGNWSHTCTGANLVIVVTSHGDVTGSFGQTCTYNSVSVPNVNSIQCPSDRIIASYLLKAPTTGANTVDVTGNTFNRGMAVSYTGVNQNNTPDGNATQTAAGGSSSISQSFTVTAANCWMVVGGYCGTSGAPNSGSGVITTQRGNTGDGGNMWDSNATIGTGSQTGGLGFSASSNGAMVMMSIAPTSGARLLTLMGVGT